MILARFKAKIFSLPLFWQIYLFGFVLLITITVAGVASLWFLSAPPRLAQTPQRLVTIIADKLDRYGDYPARLQAELDGLQYLLQASIAVHDRQGNTVVVSGPDPAAPLSSREARELTTRAFWGRGMLAVTLPGRNPAGRYVILSHDKRLVHHRLMIILLGLMIFLALLAHPLARLILQPLKQVSRTARELGAGKLAARTGIVRGDEIGLLAATIDDMAARLEILLTTEKEMLANISHEFRTPLARMRVAVELARESGGATANADHLEVIEAEVGELDQLVHDVLLATRLDLSRVGGMPLPLNREPVRLADLLDRTATRFAHQQTDRQLLVDPAADLPTVLIDRTLFQRVLDNLLENSLKYSKPGTPIRLAAPAGPVPTIRVSDQGHGLADQDLDRLFEPFYRGEQARVQIPGGMGLGLALCRRIVEAHGGTITASRAAEGGLAVTIILPG